MLQHLPTLLEGPLSWQKKKTKKCLRHLVLKIKTKSALSVALTILPAVLDRYSALESAINGHAKHVKKMSTITCVFRVLM